LGFDLQGLVQKHKEINMRQEVSSAVDFITNILRTARNHGLNKSQIETFRSTLNMLLISHYENHWFPEKPCKGSGYRCIRINHKMDPMVARAASTVGLRESDLFLILPSELTLWVDPEEVAYRIGEEGSIGTLFGQDSSSSSGSDSEGSSRTPSPVSYHPAPRSLSHSPNFHSGHYSPVSSSPVHFMQSCKDQLRYYMPESENYDYINSFMAS